jgi:HPt (histidine-containing phosphotransfer) domain-containing protein
MILFLRLLLLTVPINVSIASANQMPTYHYDKGPLVLKGSWLFFQDKFLNFDDIDRWQEIPHERLSIPQKLPRNPARPNNPAWGTLLLRLENLDSAQQDLAITIRANTAFKIQLYNPNHALQFHQVLQVGKVAATAGESLPENVNRIGVLRKEHLGSEVYLVVHISGWHFDDASVWGLPKISTLAATARYEDWTRFIETLVLGILAMMALYFFSFTLRKNSDPAAFWLACLSFFTALRLVLTSGNLLLMFDLTPSIQTYSLMRKLEYATVPALGYTGIVFVVHCFGSLRLRRFMKFDTWLALFLFGLCFVTPAASLRTLLPLLNGYLLVQFVLGLWVSISSARVNTAATITFTLGLTVNFATALHDIALGTGISWTTGYFLSPIGVAVLIFSQGQILAINFEKAYKLANRTSKDLQLEVERQTAEVKSIMNTIPQGIMTIDNLGRIESLTSLQVKSILKNSEIEGQAWSAVLLENSKFLPDEQQIAVESMRLILGEDLVNYDMNQHNLPLEIQYPSGPNQGTVLELTWSPVLTKDSKVDRILVTIFDATEKKQKELAAAKNEQEIRLIRELVAIPLERFLTFRDTAQSTTADTDSLITQGDLQSPEVLRKIYLNSHTLKGSARTLGLLHLANELHAFEGIIEQLRNGTDNTDRKALPEKWQMVMASYNNYLSVNDNILGRKKNRDTSVSVPKTLLDQCSHCLANEVSKIVDQPTQNRVLTFVASFVKLTHYQLSDLVAESAQDLNRIARELGKSVPETDESGDSIYVDSLAAQALRKALVHVLRNSLDHGIEAAEEREALGKRPMGLVKFSWRTVASGVELEIADDGRGLDLASVRRKGLEKGLLTEEDAMDLNKLVNLIFHPNFSTAQQVTQFSGRGIGMNAVRSYLEDIGGQVEARIIGPSSAQGCQAFSLRMLIPWPHIFSSSPALPLGA